MSVVNTHRPADGVLVIELADREHRNLFTPALVEALMRAVADASADPSARAVVLHGYDQYFCTGGTQSELLQISAGELSFDALPLYRVLLDCALPVVAAMQGHALGGGLVMGLFADLVVLAEESLYAANFMSYGFTPGMGATLVLPSRLGEPLANELLFTARGYQGGELKRRGVPLPILRRAEVVPHAISLARELADKPREALVLLKAALSRGLREELPAAVERERAMHAACFGAPEVRRRIQERFGR